MNQGTEGIKPLPRRFEAPTLRDELERQRKRIEASKAGLSREVSDAVKASSQPVSHGVRKESRTDVYWVPIIIAVVVSAIVLAIA